MKNVKYFFGTLFAIMAVLTFGTSRGYAHEIGTVDAKTSGAVNQLIERYIDGEKGYFEASEQVNDAGLKAAFLQKSGQRKKFREDLQEKLAGLGNKYETNGSVAAAAHRAWIDTKAVVTKGDDVAVLNAARTGEEAAVKTYKDLIGSGLPEDLRKTVQEQYEDVLESYNWVNDQIKDRAIGDVKDRADEKLDDYKDANKRN